jgi:WD40 repeat protein
MASLRPLVSASKVYESANMFGVAWSESETLFVVDSGTEPGTSVVAVPALGGNPETVRLPQLRGCRLTDYLHPTRLPDGVAFYQSCLPLTEDSPRALVRYDEVAHSISPLTKGIFPFNPNQFAFHPSMEQGVFSSSSGICSGIGWIEDGSVAFRNITIPVDGEPYRLDEFLRDQSNCSGIGASWPTWSPDGETVAFLASPEAIGVRGRDRLDQPWNIYLMAADGTGPRPVLQGVGRPSGLLWSPDGQSLAFSGTLNGGEPGVWILDLETRSVRKIARNLVQDLTWNPSATSLAVVYRPSESLSSGQTELWVLDTGSRKQQ